MKKVTHLGLLVLTGLFTLLMSSRCFARTDIYRDSLLGPFTSGQNFTVSDPNYSLSGQTRKIVKNTITLNVLDNVYISAGFTYSVPLTIVYYNYSAPTTPVTVTTTLTVNYVLGQGAKYKSMDVYGLVNAYQMQVTIGTPTGSSPAGAVRLVSEIVVDRIYPFSNGPISPTYTITTGIPQLQINWASQLSADEYDVEWTTINDGNDHWGFITGHISNPDTTTGMLDTLAQVFRNNASRITLNGTTCTLSLLSTDGYILVRVRQAHYDVPGVRQAGPWDYSGNTNPEYHVAIMPLNWSEPLINWQYSAAYAEQGKKKEVISYFDGTLRGRQTVTLDNTDAVAIAQENIYDYFGRPSASILPAPFKDVSTAYLHYIPNFNLANATTPYTYSNVLGTTGVACELNPDTLDNIAGASRYYSKANPFLTGQPYNNYIPDAAGFPLSVTQYTGDNTGRIKSQGGVGYMFQPGKMASPQLSKTTKYYYGKPQQWELDQLFANDAGYAEHYLRNMVVDPNGQISVSYLNASGKTVATALTGPAPGTVDALPSYVAPTSTTTRLLKPTDFVYDATALSLTANTTLLASVASTDNLQFSMKQLIDYYPGSFVLCSNCYYNMTETVTDDCGILVASNTAVIGSAVANPTDTTTVYNTLSVPISHPGEYNVSIKLAYDSNVIQNYADAFVSSGITNNYLSRQFDYISAHYLDSLNLRGCYDDCHTCELTIGTSADFVSMLTTEFSNLGVDITSSTPGSFHAWAVGLYSQLKAHCDSISSTCTYASPCAGEEALMTTDVSPGGQYALFADSTGTELEPGTNVIADTQPGQTVPNWRLIFPVKPSTDTAYIHHEFTLPDGTLTSPNDANFTLPELIAYWNPSWAGPFVRFHPEYCQLQFCQNHQAYYGWDQRVQQDINIAATVPNIPPNGTPTLSYSYTNASDWLLPADPFFQSTGAGSMYHTAMDNDLLNYSKNVLGIPDPNPVKGLMQYVDYSLYCQNTTGNMNTCVSTPPNSWNCTPNNACRVSDREWLLYREFYFQTKQKYYNLLIAAACGTSCAVGQPVVSTLPGSCPVATDFSVQLNTDPSVTPCPGHQTVAVVHNSGTLASAVAVTLYYPPNSFTGLTTTVNFAANSSRKIICVPNGIPVSAIKVNAVYCGSGPPVYGNDPTYVVHVSDVAGGTHPNDCGNSVFTPYHTVVTLENSAGVPVNAVSDITIVINYTYSTCDSPSTPKTDPLPFIISAGSSSFTQQYVKYASCDPACDYNHTTDISCVQSLTNASNVTGLATCSSYTYSNPQKPVSTCDTALIVKTPRFTVVGSSPSGYLMTDSATLVSTTTAAVKQQAVDICTGEATAWISSLQAGLDSAGTTSAQIATLQSSLISICSAGGDQTHPMGASTRPPGDSGTPTGFGNAIQVQLLAGHPFTPLLNPWLIDAPYPYNIYQQSVPQTISNSNTSLCTLLGNLETIAGGPTLLYSYLVSTYGSAMTLSSADVSALQNSCTNCKFLISHDITLPVFLDPNATGCVNYTAYTNAKTAMNAAFGRTLTSADKNYTTILANFMNQYFGFSLSYDQYIAYETSHPGLLCNQMPYATVNADPYDCVKNQLSTVIASGLVDWNNYIATNRQAFITNYENTCSLAQSSANMTSLEQVYHYTLYYYDQADNLVRTIAPEGVNLVSPTQFNYIDKARDADTSSVNYNVPNIAASQTTALNTLSSVLSAAQGTVELWLYNNGLTSYQFAATTPDNHYQFQAAIVSNTLSIDIWPKSGSSNWHFQADITALQPLNPFALIVIEGAGLGTGPTSVRVFLNGVQVTAAETTTTGATVANNLTILKHLRLYTHQLSLANIASDGGQLFFNAADLNVAGWYRFNIPAAGTLTTVNDTSTRETAYYDTYPAHVMPTTYVYNGTNQVIQQQSPDGGATKYWYDLLSRIVVSQNAKQASNNYSYTLYDTLGRVTEVGQKNQTATPLTNPGYLTSAAITSFNGAGTNSQIIDTYYDKPVPTVSGNTNGIATVGTQINLRKRVAASTYTETQGSPALRGTYYSYDIDGNVTRLWQQLDGLYVNSTNSGLKRIDYEYDLISGKVNFVGYQNNMPDAFYYAYNYDADNRLTGALSSTQAVVDTLRGSVLPPSLRRLDARYYYYLHGPLRRMELGNDGAAVQGLDYAYTLQGWIKGVNSASGLPTQDIGLDGATVAQDAYGYSLGYYPTDYTPIGGNTSYPAFTLKFNQTAGDITGQSLYNGNIGNVTMAINQLGGPVGYTYHYDQLNRLKMMRQYSGITGSSWDRSSITMNYQENVTYDGNGNILTYGRNGNSPTTAQTIDSLTYHYSYVGGKLTHNTLNYIHDAVSASGYSLDLRNQTNSTNYLYDGIGNLIYDAASGITENSGNSITWSVYNKPLAIYKAASTISYAYNTANQRISKNEGGITTWYVRDAQGNPLALYDNNSGNTNWREQDLYGSSRLGMWLPNLVVGTDSSLTRWDMTGIKNYELDNHLGNVMTTVTDKRIQNLTTGPPSSLYFTADVVIAQDYYPFGMLQPGRNYTFRSDSTYRYGFNGKENDNTVKGLGNQQDYGNRIYDPRLGRFLSVDPMHFSYPYYSSYQFAGNTPIQAIDLDGKEPESVVKTIVTNSTMSTGQGTSTEPEAPKTIAIRIVTYRFTQPAAHLLSLVSGIPESKIQNIDIQNAAGTLFPAYRIKNGGGAVTYPGLTPGTYRMNLTDNFFSHDGAVMGYGNRDFSNDVINWLDETSHEVGHITDITEIGGGLLKYISTFAIEYIKAGSHDANVKEQRADYGRLVFGRFRRFTNQYYGADAINKLFNSKLKDVDKIKTLDKWFKAFNSSEEQQIFPGSQDNKSTNDNSDNKSDEKKMP